MDSLTIETSSMLCSVVKHLGQGRSPEKQGGTSRVFPYTSFVLRPLLACISTEQSLRGTLLFGLYRDVPLDRVWFFGLAVLNRVYNFTRLCPK